MKLVLISTFKTILAFYVHMPFIWMAIMMYGVWQNVVDAISQQWNSLFVAVVVNALNVCMVNSIVDYTLYKLFASNNGDCLYMLSNDDEH